MESLELGARSNRVGTRTRPARTWNATGMARNGPNWSRSERDEAKASQPRQTAAPRRDAGGGDTASFVRRNGPKIVAGVAALVLVGGGIALVVTGGESDEGSAGSQDESVESETGPPPATLPVLRDDETDQRKLGPLRPVQLRGGTPAGAGKHRFDRMQHPGGRLSGPRG